MGGITWRVGEKGGKKKALKILFFPLSLFCNSLLSTNFFFRRSHTYVNSPSPPPPQFPPTAFFPRYIFHQTVLRGRVGVKEKTLNTC